MRGNSGPCRNKGETKHTNLSSPSLLATSTNEISQKRAELTEKDILEIGTVQEINRNRNKTDYIHSKLQ